MSDMSRQWDALARINAAYSISSVPEFEAGDAEQRDAFWASGEADVERVCAEGGVTSSRGLTMVEIGCGIGRMTRALAARFGHVVALDVSPEMIRRAGALNGHLANTDFRVGTGVDLAGVGDRSADFVLAWFVLQHVPRARDVLRYVAECGRVLHAGGRAFLHMQTSHGTWDHARRWAERRLFYLMPEPARAVVSRSGGATLERELAARFHVWRGGFVRRRDAEREARRAGLVIESATPLGDRYTCYRLRRPV